MTFARFSAVLIALVALGCQATPGDLTQLSVLVTGAAGFIGSHLVMNLVKKGCKNVVALDDFDAYYDVYLKRVRADLIKNTTGITVTRGDVCDAALLKIILTENAFTHVVHLAAQPGVRYSFVKPLSYIRNNVECFTVLFEQIRLNYDNAKRRFPRVLYASSSSVYGLNTKIPFSEEDPVLHQNNLYGVTKRTDELLAHSYHHLYGITAIGFRFFTVYGPRGRPDMATALFSEGILSGKPITLFNKGELLRDYTFIDDIVDGLTAAVARVEDDKLLVYNLGNKKPVSTNKFLSLLEEYWGKKAVVKYEESKADMAVTFANTSLAAENLGFEAKVSIEEGLSRYVDWYKAYESSSAPCITECSDISLCFDDGWAEPAQKSRDLTKNCNVVFYTVSSHEKTSDLYDAPEDNLGCNIAFINMKSTLYRKLAAEQPTATDLTFRNWIFVATGDFGPNYKDTRKPSRVPKISPKKFFSPKVHYAVYGDTSITLSKPLKAVIEHMVDNKKGDLAVMAAVRHPIRRTISVYNEAENVLVAHKYIRKSVTMYPEKVSEQMAAYKSYQIKHDGLRFDNVFDGSLLVHDLKSPTASEFRCRWYKEYYKWSDRDQLSGGFTLGMMNFEADKSAGGKQAEWVAIGSDDKKKVFVHLLRSQEHPHHNQKKNEHSSFYRKNEFPMYLNNTTT